MSPTPSTRNFALVFASAAALACILSLMRASSPPQHNSLPRSQSSAGSPVNSRQLRSLLPDPKSVELRTPRFATTAEICPNPVEIDPKHFKSQRGEDKKIMKWLGSLCGGTYIEMGALDGVKYSNSYVFNKALGWRGVLVELLPRMYKRLVENRKNEIATIHAGVCDESQTLHYFDGKGPVGGIYEFTDKDYRRKFWKGAGLSHSKMQEIECETLDSLLWKNAPDVNYFDFFSLDVEGAELSVLRSLDWGRVGFGMLVVEADGRDRKKDVEVKKLIESHGYQYMRKYGRNYYFLNSNFEEIYGNVFNTG